MGNCGGRWRDGARPMCWRWGLPKGGAALPRAHPSHCPGDPSTLGPPLVGHETPSSANRWLVPLEASAPEDSPSMPSPSPLETTRGTVILRCRMNTVCSLKTQKGGIYQDWGLMHNKWRQESGSGHSWLGCLQHPLQVPHTL